MKTKFVFIDIELPGSAACLSFEDCNYEIVEFDRDSLCSGYGYFKEIKGVKKLIAVLSYGGKLYLYFDKFYEINSTECEVKLVKGFFKYTFSLYKNKMLELAIEYKPTSYDAGVLEDIYSLVSDKKFSELRINNTIRILSETNPVARKKVDEDCVELLEKARLRI